MLPRNLVLPHRIAELAEDDADRPAMVDVAGRSQTYGELHQSFLSWAGAYRSLGIDEGQAVVTMLPNSFEAYHAWLGAAWIGAIEVPTNNMYLGRMLEYLVNNSTAETLVIAARFLERLEPIAAALERVTRVVVPDAGADLPDLPFEVIRGDEFLGAGKPASDLPGPAHYDVASMLYTSGTTGPSKGVLVPWGELFEGPRMSPDEMLGEGEAYYTMYPAFHLSGKISLYMAANAKGRLVLRESFSVTEFWNDIRTHGVQAAGLVGPMAAMLMAMPAQPDDADNPVERVMMGPLIPDLEAFKERFGIGLVATGFGMTEIGFPISSGWSPPNLRTCGRRRSGPPGYEVRVADEHDETVPPNTVGELLVRSGEPWVMNLGYWGMPEATAASWRNGWFHTGDAFMEDEDGWLYFVDRLKDTLRRRGENVSSFEVEAGINEHPAVQESAVIGVPSDVGEDEIKAVVVVAPGASLMPEELIEFLVPRMPRFMIPRYVELADALPKTEGTFRVRKVELRQDALNERTWDRERPG